MAFNILGGNRQGSILGGNAGDYAPPRVPWASNPLVTTVGLSLLGAPTLRQGMQNVAANAPAGIAAKTAWQDRAIAAQEKAAQTAAWNAALKKKSGIALTPEDDAALARFPQIALSLFPEKEKPMVVGADSALYDPNTGQWTTPPGGGRGFRMATPEEATQYGATAGQFGPDGRFYPINPPSGMTVESDGQGGFKLVQGPGAGKNDPKRADVALEGQVQKAETMLDATRSIKREIEQAKTPVTGSNSIPFAFHSGTPAGRVRSYVGALKSGTALQAILRLKEASTTGATGFGALSAPELQLLVDDIGSLDPDNTEDDIFLKTVDRIERRWMKVLDDVRRTVPPEKLAELGIDLDAVAAAGLGDDGQPDSSAPITSPADPLGIR